MTDETNETTTEETTNETTTEETEVVEELSIDELAKTLYKEETEETEEETEETKEKPKSKELKKVLAQEKKNVADRKQIKAEKEELQKEKDFINSFKEKSEKAKTDLVAGIALFEELVGVEWDVYLDKLASGEGDASDYFKKNEEAKKAKEEADKKAKEEAEHQELSKKNKAQVSESLTNFIKSKTNDFELINKVGIEIGVEAVLLKIEEFAEKEKTIPDDATILKWINEVEANCGEYIKTFKTSKKAQSILGLKAQEEEEGEETPESTEEEKNKKKTLSKTDEADVPVEEDFDINSLPWDKQIEYLNKVYNKNKRT